MKKILSLMLMLVLLAGCTTIQETKTPDPPKSLSYEDRDFGDRFEKTKPGEETLKTLWNFTEKSYALLRTDENRLYSPLSLYLALSMLQEGAQGKTLEQLQGLLGELDPKGLSEHLSVDSEAGRVLLANSLWAQKGFPIKEEYKNTLIEKYFATSDEVDLSTKEGMETISSWIAKQTMDKIKPKLEPDEMYRLFLVNTLYLKSAWNEAFPKESTKEDIFHGEKEIKADFMKISLDRGKWYQGSNFTLGEKQLSEGSKMVFVLPIENSSLKDLDLRQIISSLDKAKSTSINWSMPKLHLSDELDLIPALKNLGVEEAFEEYADFSKISDEDLFVSLIKQFTDLVLDEDGAEAAAATVAGMEMTSAMPEEPVEMNLNRPYLLMLIHRDVPLFIGEVYEPESN